MDVLICEGAVVLPDRTVTCANWQTIPYESMALKTDLIAFDELFSLDIDVFSQVLVGLLATFVIGHITGICIKWMNRV